MSNIKPYFHYYGSFDIRLISTVIEIGFLKFHVLDITLL